MSKIQFSPVTLNLEESYTHMCEAQSILKTLIQKNFEITFNDHFSQGFNAVLKSAKLHKKESCGGYGHKDIWLHLGFQFDYSPGRKRAPLLQSITLTFKGEITRAHDGELPLPISNSDLTCSAYFLAEKRYMEIKITGESGIKKILARKHEEEMLYILRLAFDRYTSH